MRCLNIFILCNKGPRLYTDNKDIRQQKVLYYPLIFRMIREYVQDTEMLSNRNIGTYPTTGYHRVSNDKSLQGSLRAKYNQVCNVSCRCMCFRFPSKGRAQVS